MANGQQVVNPLLAFTRAFQQAQRTAQQAAQQEEENALTQQLRQIQLLNAQRQVAEALKTPEQRAQEALTAQLITQAVAGGGVRAAEPGLQGLDVAIAQALAPQTQTALESGTITPQAAIATVPPVEFETPVPGVGGAFVESPVLARQEQARKLAEATALAGARRAPVPPGFQLITDENGFQSLVQVRGAGAGTGVVTPVKTEEGEQVKAPQKVTGRRSILAEDKNGRLTNVVLDPGQALPEGFKEHTKPSRSISDPSGLRKEFNALQVVKDFREISPQFQRMQEAIQESRAGGSLIAVDQTLINTFNKILDPDSVVREGEYARTAADQSVLDFLKGKFDAKTGKLSVGGAGLTPENRQAMIRMAERFFNASRGNFDQTARFYEDVSERSGIDPTLVIQGIEDIRQRTPDVTPPANPPAAAPTTSAPASTRIGRFTVTPR